MSVDIAIAISARDALSRRDGAIGDSLERWNGMRAPKREYFKPSQSTEQKRNASRRKKKKNIYKDWDRTQRGARLTIRALQNQFPQKMRALEAKACHGLKLDSKYITRLYNPIRATANKKRKQYIYDF